MTRQRIKQALLGGPFAVAMLGLAVAALVLAGPADPTGAQVGQAAAVNQYAAKFLCGTIPSPADPAQTLAPGVYNTAVNIHNPNNFAVTIEKKAVISVEEPGQGLPGPRATHLLRPDASMEVDCAEIFQLLVGATPACGGAAAGFCKGYVVVEGARVIVTPTGGVKIVAAQLDVTDVLTVKEEDGIWKDYTFKLSCLTGTCTAIPNYRFNAPYNLPVKPPIPPCYSQPVDCHAYDVDQAIRQRVDADCGFCGLVYQPDVVVQLVRVDMDTDSRAVDLDFEFVRPKRVVYSNWGKQPCDLQVSKVGQPGVPTGGTITYTITISCVGTQGSGGNVHVHDLWPPIVIFAGPTPSQGTCGPATANPFECDLGPIAAGGSATITFSVDTGSATVQDTATVDPHNTSGDPVPGNNSVTITDIVP